MNDVTKDNWRSYLAYNITTDGRWLSSYKIAKNSGTFVIPDREYLPKPDPQFHGVYIAEIPYQMLLRFTRKGDKVWSMFGGSGVDYEVSKLLQRHIYITDISPYKDFIEKADSRYYRTPEKVNLILSHPPYWNIIKYDDIPGQGSSAKTLQEFLFWWQDIIRNAKKNLVDKGFFILVCGNIYKQGEEVELGSILKEMLVSEGFTLKQHIIKDYGETKGGRGASYNLNYYRGLKNGYGGFYGDNIYILQKRWSPNKIHKLLKQFI